MDQQRGVEGEWREQAWPSTLMVWGIFVVLISFWWVGPRTLVQYADLGRCFALFAFAGNLVPYKRMGLLLGMERLEWFLFNLLAVGPLVFSAVLWMNLLVHGPEQLTIVRFDGDVRGLHNYWSERAQLLPTVSEVPDPGNVRPLQYGEHLMGKAKGLFGFHVISTWERQDGWSD